PIGPFADANALGRLAFPLAHELYPNLMDRKVNQAPELPTAGFWVAQVFLFPLPLFGAARSLFWSPPSDYRRGWWVLLFALPALFLLCGPLAGFAGLFPGPHAGLAVVLAV